MGVDYVGVQMNGNAQPGTIASTVNYTLDEYVGDVIYNVQRVCVNEGVPEPHLVSESRRAITAHHILRHHERLRPHRDRVGGGDRRRLAPEAGRVEDRAGDARDHLLHDAPEPRRGLPRRRRKEEALQMFKLGILGLEERAVVESLFTLEAHARHPRELNRGRSGFRAGHAISATRSPTSTWRTSRSSRARGSLGVRSALPDR